MKSTTPFHRFLRSAVVSSVLAVAVLGGAAGTAAASGVSDARAIGDNLVSIEADAEAGSGRVEIEFIFGDPGDDPFGGSARPSDGFVYLRNSNTTGIADIEFFFGDPEDVP